jgi:hypothetical protein
MRNRVRLRHAFEFMAAAFLCHEQTGHLTLHPRRHHDRIMEELRQKILETGLLPSDMVDVTPNKVEGVDG